jgi:hypothetical protein
MHRFVHATVFVAGISAAVVAGQLLDHSPTSVMGCGQGDCAVGGAGTGGGASNGAAQGSHIVDTNQTGTTTQSGIETTTGQTGRKIFDRLDGPRVVIDGKLDLTQGTGRGHFVNTVPGDCNGQFPC